ncbi:hypothetical protein [Paenibacillus gallinarum]|uniref:Uncharacterized protein n=1 Tax=Paenibacillus gallinarum TaxID=2762232 RepID=A0ABR8T136_9BACL|nr:hypothetical protein [Paenibacillus gallinarum]MBD7969456.1 hypothetical protein [Paenibacillus gallinarum]
MKFGWRISNEQKRKQSYLGTYFTGIDGNGVLQRFDSIEREAEKIIDEELIDKDRIKKSTNNY